MYHRVFLYSVFVLIISGLFPFLIDSSVIVYPGQIKRAAPSIEDISAGYTVEGKVNRGDVLFNILMKNDVSRDVANKFCSSIGKVFSLNKIRAGNDFSLSFNNEGALEGVGYTIDSNHYLQALLNGSEGVVTTVETVKYERKVRSVRGEIESSLFAALTKDRDLNKIAFQIADIFSWSVDFYYDLRRGDSFRVLYEELYLDGNYAGTGKVLAAELVLSGKERNAYCYRNGNDWNYYDENGKSLRKQFLKMPVKFGRVSSGFTYKRYHPILKRNKPHLGVDYAAPYGTPILATASGVVADASRNRPSGNYIILKHGNSYTTSYSHMSKYAKGIRKGAKVKQGQVIGYIGTTGYATGPHVDYRLKRNGVCINSRTFKSPGAHPVAKENKDEFKLMVSLLKSGIDGEYNSPLKIVNRTRIGRIIEDMESGKRLTALVIAPEKTTIKTRQVARNGQFHP